jgi:hypothetical protein
MGGSRVEDAVAVALREDLRASTVDEERRVPHRQEAHRRRRVLGRQRQAREVDELLALLVLEAAQLEALENTRDVRLRDPGPACDVVGPRRAEPGEVPANQNLDPLMLADLLRAHPVLGERVDVGAAAIPGPRGRYADEVEEEADAVPRGRVRLEDAVQLGLRQRAVREVRPGLADSRLDLPPIGLVGFDPLLAPPAPDPDDERPVVALGDEMDRRPHQRPLDDGLPAQRAGELVPLEALEPRPEPDVRRGRVLRLDPADPFQRAGQRRLRPLEQELPREQRPVQLPFGERPKLGHRLEANRPS